MPIMHSSSPIEVTSWSMARSHSRAPAGNCCPIPRCGPLISRAATAEEMTMSTSVLALTVVMFGAGGFLMGQVVADTWRPWWHVLPYGALLAIANQFLGFALFGGPFIVDSLVSTGSLPLGSAIFGYLVEF